MNTTKIYRFCELRKAAKVKARVLYGKRDLDTYYYENGTIATITEKVFPFLGFTEVYADGILVAVWGYKA